MYVYISRLKSCQMTYDLKFKTTWDYKLVPDLPPK